MKSYEEKLLAMVIKPKKIEALDRHLKLRALGFFIIFKVASTSFPRARARQTSYPRGPTREESKTNMAAVCPVRERLFCPV